MALQLPWELEEEILSRLPPQSIVRFRTVSKQWNTVFNDKSFLKNHLSRSRPQFIFVTHSKVYSIDIIDPNSMDPTIELRELPIPYGEGILLDKFKNISRFISCDELLFCKYHFETSWTALWNPWLRQVKWFKNDARGFFVFGLGYDNEKFYKILGYFVSIRENSIRVAIYDCASQELKFIDKPDKYWFVSHERNSVTSVSLNGNLYWLTCNLETCSDYYAYIRSFDFSRETFKPFCLLPCQMEHRFDLLLLAVYKGDRFSLLKQCCVTRKIGVWVTKEMINSNNGDDEECVVWINLMTLSITSLPNLFGRISYYISDKTLFMCCADDETRVACVYIVRAEMCKKIQIDSGIVECFHCVYTPNLISVP